MPTVLNLPSPASTVGGSSIPTHLRTYNSNSTLQFYVFHPNISITTKKFARLPIISCYYESNPSSTIPSPTNTTPNSSPPSQSETRTSVAGTIPPPIRKTRRRYRKQYPGEDKGISEEMRFVAMRLRNTNKTRRISESESDSSDKEIDEGVESHNNGESENNGSEVELSDNEDESSPRSSAAAASGDGGVSRGETWEPSVEGFVNYLVNSKLIFDTVERIVDDSTDVSYVYFRNTGLERSESISKDLEWFSQQDVLIPEPSKPGVTYANYLKELAEKSPPLFLCHFYNIYFSHIAGGQVITNEVSKRIFEGKKLEFSSWPGNEEELLRDVREKLNMLGEHWSRNEKTKCLVEARKAFRYLGHIVRLIIL